MVNPSGEVFVFTCCTGSGGNVGGHAVRAFHSRARKEGRNVNIRLAVRTPAKAKKAFADLSTPIEVVQMDLQKPETFKSALDGASVVFVGQPDIGGLDSDELLESFVHAVETTQPKSPYVVKFCGGALYRIMPSICEEVGCNILDVHFKAAKVLRSARAKSRLHFSIVDIHSWFFQNYTSIYVDLVKSGELAIPNGNACLPYIDTRDIGEFIATLMLDVSKYEDEDFALTGGHMLTTSDWADLISKSTGRRITHSNSEAPIRQVFSGISVAPGVTMWDEMKTFFEVERLIGERFNGQLHPEVYESMTGKRHRSPSDFCSENASTPCWGSS